MRLTLIILRYLISHDYHFTPGKLLSHLIIPNSYESKLILIKWQSYTTLALTHKPHNNYILFKFHNTHTQIIISDRVVVTSSNRNTENVNKVNECKKTPKTNKNGPAKAIPPNWLHTLLCITNQFSLNNLIVLLVCFLSVLRI